MFKKILFTTAAVFALNVAPATVIAGDYDHDGKHTKKEMHSDKKAHKKADKPNIVEIAAGDENFSTLVAALEAADLVDAIKEGKKITVFAPTNDAFAKLPEGTVEDLLKPENKEKLQSILKYHVADQKIKGKYLLNGSTEVATLQGGTITIAKNDEGATVNGANILKTDIWGSNGVVHVIDTVILPE